MIVDLLRADGHRYIDHGRRYHLLGLQRRIGSTDLHLAGDGRGNAGTAPICERFNVDIGMCRRVCGRPILHQRIEQGRPTFGKSRLREAHSLEQ